MAKEENPTSEVDEESSNGDEEDEEEEDFDEDEDEGEDFDEDEDEEEESPVSSESRIRTQRAKMERLLRRISSERVPVRVHDVSIKGNKKTKESLIEAEVEALKTATSVKELIQAATIANSRLQKLDIFDSVRITLDSGPPELPGTSTVIVEVVESKNPLSGDIGVFTKPEAWSWSLAGSLKLKNLFGYGDLWDGSLSVGWDQTSEVSAGVSLPRFFKLFTPVMARISLLSQEWLRLSSYNKQALGLSLGLLSTRNHDLAYNLTLIDPSQMASKSIVRQLGHGLLSHLKYTFKIDRRNSPLRPTKGFAFVSTSQLGGIFPDYRSLHFIRQEFDLRYALPLGLARSALNFGVACGVLFPWGSGFLNAPASLPDRFFLGRNSSPVCTLGGSTSLLGFKIRGLGPSEPRQEVKEKSEDTNSDTSSGRNFFGGDLAVTAFADLSFDLPLKVWRDSNIYGHAFACAGSLTKLTENTFRDFSFQKYRDSFKSSAGFGLIVPTKLFRMEVSYCYILKHHEHDQAKTGVQFSFSSPL